MLGQCVCTAVGTTWIRGKNAHKLLTQNSDHVVGNEIIRAYSLKWIELAGNSDSESIYAKEWSELAIYTFPPTDLLHYILCSSVQFETMFGLLLPTKMEIVCKQPSVNKTIEILRKQRKIVCVVSLPNEKSYLSIEHFWVQHRISVSQTTSSAHNM